MEFEEYSRFGKMSFVKKNEFQPVLGEVGEIPNQLAELQLHPDEIDIRMKRVITNEPYGKNEGEENEDDVEIEAAERAAKCGWLWFRPSYLQKFRTAKWALFWLCWAGAMQGISNPLLYIIALSFSYFYVLLPIGSD